MSLRKNISYNMVSTVLLNSSRWFYSFLAARFLTSTEFSLFSFVVSSSNLLLPLFTFGVSLGLLRDIPIFLREEKGKEKILNIEGMFWGYVIFISVSSLILASMLSHLVKLDFFTLVIIITITFVLSILKFTQSILKALSLFSEELKTNLFYSLFLLLTTLILAVFKVYYFQYLILSLLLTTLITIGYSIKKISHLELLTCKPTFKIKTFIQNYLKYGSHEILVAIYTNSVSFLSFFILSSNEYATFRKLLLISVPFVMISGSIAQVILNKFSTVYSTDKKNLIRIFREVQKKYLLVSITGYIITILIFFPISPLLNLERQYLLYHSILSLSILFRFISSLYGVFLTTLGLQSLRIKTVTLASIASISLLFLLAPSLHLWGIIASYLASFLIIFILYLYFGELKIRSLG